jgi:nucleotide-binding universal stress UspA family protein
VADRVLRQSDVPVLLVPPGCERTWSDDRTPRILVPLDGSDLAAEALAPADELAEALGAELLLLGVLLPSVPLVTDGTEYTHGFDEKAALDGVRQYLETTGGGLREGGRAVDTMAVAGYPPAAIAAVAREVGVDAIVMATHGRGGLKRLVMGSVATGVLQRTPAPLLVVRPAAIRDAAKPATRPATAPATAVSVRLSERELELVELGLEELLGNLGPDHRLAAAVSDLLARLKQAVPAAAETAS